MESRFRALLVDVGGTLVPDNLPSAPGVRETHLRRLAALLPGLEPDRLEDLLDRLRADARDRRDDLEQRTEAGVAARLAEFDPALSGQAGAVCRALGRPTEHEHPPFPGHRDLLLAAGELGMRRVLVSNTAWVSDDDWRRWWLSAREMEGLVEGIVTSHSAGRRKPDRGMFDRALALAGCGPDECVFIGDKEGKDVEPALALGMTVIRVAIQEPPTPTRAHHLATSLAEATELLRSLRAAPGAGLTKR